MKIEKIIINHLELATERKKYVDGIKETFSHIPIHINKGIYGQELSEEEVSNYNLITRWNSSMELKKGKIGCYLTHKNALKYIVKNKLNNVLVLEDDVFYTGDKSIEEYPQPEQDISYLCYSFADKKARKTNIYGTLSILYTYDGAKDLLNYLDNLEKIRGFDYQLNWYNRAKTRKASIGKYYTKIFDYPKGKQFSYLSNKMGNFK